MKPAFYSRLACGGISKNRKTYVPYIVSCVIMVMIHYIVSFLSVDENIAHMRGGDMLQSFFGFGTYVVGCFSLVFLFYTNSFFKGRGTFDGKNVGLERHVQLCSIFGSSLEHSSFILNYLFFDFAEFLKANTAFQADRIA